MKWLPFLLIAGLALSFVAGCAVRMYGNVKCKGECEVTVDREVRELEPLPDTLPVKGK
jgi:hypothetical protein